jgi:hypothetical protein
MPRTEAISPKFIQNLTRKLLWSDANTTPTDKRSLSPSGFRDESKGYYPFSLKTGLVTLGQGYTLPWGHKTPVGQSLSTARRLFLECPSNHVWLSHDRGGSSVPPLPYPRMPQSHTLYLNHCISEASPYHSSFRPGQPKQTQSRFSFASQSGITTGMG